MITPGRVAGGVPPPHLIVGGMRHGEVSHLVLLRGVDPVDGEFDVLGSFLFARPKI
jgi:hypothetical protein